MGDEDKAASLRRVGHPSPSHCPHIELPVPITRPCLPLRCRCCSAAIAIVDRFCIHRMMVVVGVRLHGGVGDTWYRFNDRSATMNLLHFTSAGAGGVWEGCGTRDLVGCHTCVLLSLGSS
jgi:hypothetical protein